MGSHDMVWLIHMCACRYVYMITPRGCLGLCDPPFGGGGCGCSYCIGRDLVIWILGLCLSRLPKLKVCALRFGASLVMVKNKQVVDPVTSSITVDT